MFVLSGLYNVSASREHLDVTTWLLDLVRRQSIRTYSLDVGQPPGESPGTARLGAAHYELGCAACHGAPGRPPSALHAAMLGIRHAESQREATILRYRFGLDGGPEKTLEEVGQKFGVTRERVRQIQNIALNKLRKMIEKLEAQQK